MQVESTAVDPAAASSAHRYEAGRRVARPRWRKLQAWFAVPA